MLWCKLYFFLGSKFKEGKLIQPVTRAWGTVLGLFSNEKGKSICFKIVSFMQPFLIIHFPALDPLYIPLFFLQLQEFGKHIRT